MNSRNNSTKNINELVKTATNKLDTTTEKVKDDLVSTFSNQLKNASARERKLMEGELLVYLEELFKELHDEGLGKEERKQLLRQYKLYVHLTKELNFKMALDQIKRHEELRDQEKIEKKKRKKKKTEKKLKRKLKEKLRKETNKKTNQVIGNENNTGNNKATQEGNGIQVNGNGNVVILGGHYREWGENYPTTPANPTTTPANPTTTPANPTTTPANPTTTPANPTTTPANLTTTPANLTTTPANLTTTPANLTTTPANLTTTPANLTTTPANLTTTPANLTTTPANPDATPDNPDATPDNPDATPDNPDATPANPTTTPANLTTTPANLTTTPANLTTTPANPTTTPANPTTTPANPTTTPANPDATPDNPDATPDNPDATPDNPDATPDNPDDYEFDLTASLSDVENIHLENARYKAEEQIKEKYRNLNKSNVIRKLAGKLTLFLSRGLTRKKLIQEEMKKAKNKPFGDDAAVNLELGKGVNRQELESFFQGKNAQVVFKDIPELNQLSIDFIKGKVSEGDFQTQFNTIVKNQNRQERQKNGIKNINYLGTNILEKLKFEKAQLELVNELAERLDQGADTTEVQTKIEDFLKNYQKNPDFLEKIKADLAARNITNIKGYFKLQKAKRAMALKNLKMKLKLFTDKKSAYQIDNSDREKGWIFKLGKKIDKLPRWAQTLGFTGTGVLVGLTGGALGLGVVGTSALTTGTFAGMTGFKNFIKKWTHYTKEQNTHEKNMTRNLSNELAKIEKRKQDSLLKGAKNWYRSYRAKRQLNLYNNATQDFFGTKEISKKLLDFGATLNTPSDTEKDEILNTLVDAKARLEAYYQTGHNFLASEDLAHIESDMNELHMAIDMVCKKLGLEYTKIDSETAKKNLISDYNNSFSVFKKQRAKLARKYGAATGAISAGTAIGTQRIMGTGMFSQEAVPGSTISKPNITGKEYFGLGSSDLGNVNTGGGQIHDGVKNAFNGLGDNATVNIHYGAGTDATQVLPGSKLLDTSAYQAKIADIIKEIDMLNLSKDQKLAFIKQFHDEPWKVEWNSKVFTSDILHGQRCAEGLLETARGLAHSGSKVVPEFSYDSAMNIAGSKIREQSERFFDINMEIVENIPGKPGSGRSWWIPISRFDNTFKKDPEKSGSGSTTSTPDNSTTPTPGDSANQGPITKEEAEKKDEEAEKKDEEAEKKNEEAKKKNEETKKKNEETEKKNEEAKKKNEEAKKKNEETEKKNEEAEKKNEEAKKKNEDTEKKNEEAEKKNEEAEKKNEEAKKKNKEAEKKNEETEKKNEEAEKKNEETEKKNEEAEKQTELEINENDSQSVKNIKAEINNAINELNRLEIQDNLYKSRRSKIKKEKLDAFDKLIKLNKDTITKRKQKIQDLKVKLKDQLKAEGKLSEETTTEQNREQTKKDSTTSGKLEDVTIEGENGKKNEEAENNNEEADVNEQNSNNEPISQDRADKKAREFRDKYTEYRKLFIKDEDKDIGKLLNDLFTDVTKSGIDKKSPEEKFKLYEDAIQDLEELNIQDLEELKKQIGKILSKRKTSS